MAGGTCTRHLGAGNAVFCSLNYGHMVTAGGVALPACTVLRGALLLSYEGRALIASVQKTSRSLAAPSSRVVISAAWTAATTSVVPVSASSVSTRRPSSADLRCCRDEPVRSEGLEPPRPRGHQALDLARLPVPPRAQALQAAVAPGRRFERRPARVRASCATATPTGTVQVEPSYPAPLGAAPALSTDRQRDGSRPAWRGARLPAGLQACRRIVHASDGWLLAPEDSNLDNLIQGQAGCHYPKGDRGRDATVVSPRRACRERCGGGGTRTPEGPLGPQPFSGRCPRPAGPPP